MAAGRVLGAGAPRVRREARAMTAAAPLFRVVHGNPSAEETAALAVVLAAKLAARPAEGRTRGSTAG
ncbi:MAG: hypothetical protein J2P30_10100, partial [Actinobacteria bacterium]|nr:hypothetical protein [Actinomycetota bacterium]